MTAGRSVTGAPSGFLPGLRVTIPTGWFASEQDAGEFSLHPRIAAPESVQIFVSTVYTAAGDHTFLVVLDAPSPSELKRFATEAKPIVDSIALPAFLVDN